MDLFVDTTTKAKICHRLGGSRNIQEEERQNKYTYFKTRFICVTQYNLAVLHYQSAPLNKGAGLKLKTLTYLEHHGIVIL
jgi:hypothetical protein